MKKLLTLTLAALMIAGAAQLALAADDDTANSIMSQIKTFKANYQEKTGEEASEEAAKEKAPEAASEAESSPEPEAAPAPEAQKSEAPAAPNPAAAEVERLTNEAAAKAAKELETSDNNRGVTKQPTEETAPEPAAPEPEEPAEATAKAPAVQILPQVEPPQPQPQAVSPAPAAPAKNPSPMQAGDAETAESLSVTADWLKANLNKVVLIDARPESLYLGGHIPGAINAQWTYFANMNAKQGTEQWGVIWNEATMAKRLGALGIDGKKTVIAYCDAGGWGQSGWTLWILRQAGVKNAKILEGGIGAWKAAGGKMDKSKVKAKTVPFSIGKYIPTYTTTTQWIIDNLGKPELVVIDVRTQPEYNGKIRPFQEKRAGHLPGAIHIPRENFVTDDGRFKSAEEMQALLAPYGITADTEIVLYDTAGVRSAFVTMCLRSAGYTKSRNYDAGFQAWAGNPDLPIVTQ